MEVYENKNSNNGMILSMNDEDKNENMSIGLFLKMAREKKSLSIDAISRHTKISSTNLEYLENNNKSALPNIAYVKGFVKSYCKIVDIDLDYALSLLDELYQVKTEKIEVVEQIKIINEYEPQVKKPTGMPTTNNANLYKATAAILLIAVAVGIITSRKASDTKTDSSAQIETDSVAQPLSLSKTTPLNTTDTDVAQVETIQNESKIDETAQDSNQALAPVPEVKNEPVVAVEIKPEPVVVEKKVEVKPNSQTTEIKKEKIELKDKIEFYNLPFPLYKIDPNTNEDISYVPVNYRNSISPDLQNVFITAVDGDSWITYKKDSDPVKKFVLKQGRYIMIRGNDIRLFLGNVNATKVFLNNNLLDVNTTSSVKSLVFPQELAKKLKLPLFVFKKDGTAITSEEYIKNNEEN